MNRVFTYLFSALLALLFATALWLRVTSLESLPDVNGDEVWHAIQLTHMMRGESFSLITDNGLLLSPFHAILEVPFLLSSPPPCGLCGFPP